jgi:3-dehydro-L-gulonate 2-dehydrogenase
MKIPFEELFNQLLNVLLKNGFEQEKAMLCARLFTEASLDGVYSHGLNRFPAFIKDVQSGVVNPHAIPEKVTVIGSALERWDGNLGPGNLNAYRCMARAIKLAKAHGMGGVALRNTNHWMRAGTYGWQAADAGCLAVCFTNTIGNMPPWGGVECRVGNNPLVIAVPRKEGHIVLDMAMSLFSYGKLNIAKSQQQPLPFAGGYDQDNKLTRDAAQILQTKRLLPIGYWKGSGMALMLDLFAAILSDGRSTADIGMISDANCIEQGISQFFLCFHVSQPGTPDLADRIASELVEWIHATQPADKATEVTYPGERTLRTRRENLEHGVPVDEAIWNTVLAL